MNFVWNASVHNPRKRKYNRLIGIVGRLGISAAGLIAITEPGQSEEVLAHLFGYSPSYSWAGAYIGIQAGQAWGHNHYAVTPPWPPAPGFPMDMMGGLVGPYVGYNFQSGALVAGIEVDFAQTWLRSQPVLNPQDNITTKSEIDWTASIRGRVGYAFGNVMPYIAGGVTFAGVNFPYVLPSLQTYDNGQTRLGWTAGAGLEYAVTGNLIVRGEYRYTDLGEEFRVQHIGTGFHFHPNDTSITSHEIRAGMALKFGGAPSLSIDKMLTFGNAPPVVWSGLYAGALASFENGHSNYIGLTAVETHVPLNPSGTIPWLYAGYNFQFGRIVLGAEGDIQLLKMSGGGALIDHLGKVDPAFQVTSQMSSAWSARGRLGFAFGNFLPYVTAGVAGADYTHTIEFFGQHRPFNERFTSWTAGAGLDYALSDHLILRVEYRYTPYGQATNRHSLANTVNLTVDEVRAGLAFKL